MTRNATVLLTSLLTRLSTITRFNTISFGKRQSLIEAYNLYQDTIKIEATFLFPEANYNTIQLTYNGVTENYH